jgi:hypothetical protein
LPFRVGTLTWLNEVSSAKPRAAASGIKRRIETILFTILEVYRSGKLATQSSPGFLLIADS